VGGVYSTHGGYENCLLYINSKTRNGKAHSGDLEVDGIEIYNSIYKSKCKGVG
jgi:hypothetical protein